MYFSMFFGKVCVQRTGPGGMAPALGVSADVSTTNFPESIKTLPLNLLKSLPKPHNA